MSGAAAFLNGLANGGRYIQRQKKLDEQESRQTEGYGMAGDHYGTQRDIPAQRSGRQVRRNNSAGTSTGRAVRVNDPVADDLPPHARAFLNAISARESGGAYNVRYSPEGGATYDVESGQHPRIFEKGPEGPSSAAGRYQFTATTWDDTGGGEFSRYNQDHRAWQLAQDRYRAARGGSLDEALQNGGVNSSILTALAPTWAAFDSRSNHGDIIATYNDSYSRYGRPAPAAEPAPATRPAARQLPASKPMWDWTHKLSLGEAA